MPTLFEAQAGSTTSAVDDAVGIVKACLTAHTDDTVIRKVVSLPPADRRKVRRRHVDTDVPVSVLVHDAAMNLLKDHDEIQALTPRKRGSRDQQLTVAAPATWWRMLTVVADGAGVSVADIVATAIRTNLPSGRSDD